MCKMSVFWANTVTVLDREIISDSFYFIERLIIFKRYYRDFI